ncbi:glycosyltransferase family 2 protein [Herbaspirillum seropedicae]|uniref:glycosyltransferase family 2 protein n=1 Tax=Herbaspirillum seropedicae TaxID=964 RepID=UPI0008482219|nr:glycosyltransferase [Herbaspirillum seropedicae]AON56561.1 Glycosyltransferase [Herbaspirillum seropedicae]MDR6395957.1 GT2 family glycosyltransferase [Herbaspirillum seropedicae]
MAAPIVSVIIPTYNHAHFLTAALDSVRNQTCADWEAIVIDNFSSDDTVAVVERFGDPRIRLVQFANQGIIASSRNHGIALTTAPYVAFLDSDDTWESEKLELSLAKLQEGYDLVCHAETWVGPGSRRREVIYGPRERASYDSMLFDGNCISTSAVVVARKLLEQAGGFSEHASFNTAEDYDLWLKLAALGARMEFIPRVLGQYLIHTTNQSKTPLRNMQAISAVFEHHLQQLPAERASPKRVAHRRGTIFYSGARSLHAAGHFHEAWRYYWKALQLYPGRMQTWVAIVLNALRIVR